MKINDTFKDFKNFALKGNIIDMAIGVIIGGAFGKIVTSLVSDIVMPVLSLITGKIKFENLFIALDGHTYETIEAAQTAGVSTLNYGMFITSVIDFLIIAISVFIAFKQISSIHKKLSKKKEVEPAPDPSKELKECPFCKTSINKLATRCPNCTSTIEIEPESIEEKENKDTKAMAKENK